MRLMPTMKDHGFWVRSHAHKLLLKKRFEDNRHITIEEVANACKVSLSTAKRFLADEEGSVSQGEIIAAIEIADYFGVPLYGVEDSLLSKVPGKAPKREVVKGTRGRPKKEQVRA